MQYDEYRRHAGEVLQVAQPTLGDDQSHEDRGAALHHGWRAQCPSRNGRGQCQADQQEHQVGVQLGDVARVEGQAGDLRVSGVRSGPGDQGADDEHGCRAREQGPGEQPQFPPYGGGDRAAHPLQQCHRGSDEREARQEVQDEDVGVQAGQDQQATHDGLDGHDERLHQREPTPGAWGPTAGDDQRDPDQLHDDRQQPVAELDVAVHTQCRGVGEGPARAARPGRASQA